MMSRFHSMCHMGHHHHHHHFRFLVIGGAVVVAGVLLHRHIKKRKRASSRTEAPPNTAVIYQIKRGPNAPSMSPFPLKLETFCRLAKIPYVVNTSGIPSSRGKFPWMEYNGQTVDDSQFCIEFFNKKLGVDMNAHLDAQRRGVSKLIQVMADEHLYWTMVYFRWIHDNDYFPSVLKNYFRFPWFGIAFIRKKIREQLYSQGIGRHTSDQIRQIAMNDLQALSDILGDKTFMLGEVMCEGDCAAFGMIAQFVWHQEDQVLGNMVKNNFPNLEKYCFRIKDKLWPDWEENCRNPNRNN